MSFARHGSLRSPAGRATAAFAGLAALTLAALTVVTPSIAVAADDRKPGYLVPIGGALARDNAVVWQRLVELAGGRGARFVVLATASENPASVGAETVATLQSYGAIAEALPVAPRLAGTDAATAANDPRWVARVDAATGVFLTGGAQERIVDTLLPAGNATPLLEAIRRVHARGGVIAGTSAGAAVMSPVMFRDAQDNLRILRGHLQPGREIDRGLGFTGPGILVDQHFLARGRLGRLLPLMVEARLPLGIGVDEDTAAVLHGHSLEVIGASGVVVARLPVRPPAAARPFELRGVELHYLEHGDRVALTTFQVAPSLDKRGGSTLDPSSATFRPYYPDARFSADILASGSLVPTITRLVDSPATEVRGLAFDPRPAAGDAFAALGFEFRFYKLPGTTAWFTTAGGGERYTITKLGLDVRPVRMAQPLYEPWRP